MNKSIPLGLVMLLAECFGAAQDTLYTGKALNFPTRKFGISIGNSPEFNGVRINFADKHVKKVNGLNITFWPDPTQSIKQWSTGDVSYSSSICGISAGVLPLAGSMKFVNIGLVGIAAAPGCLSGISMGGLGMAASAINGVSVCGLLTQANKINGIALAGLMLGGVRGINGLSISGLLISSDVRDINGMALTGGMVYCGSQFRGAGIAGFYLKAEAYKGFAVAGYARTVSMTGLSLALFNRTDYLVGLQVGLLNYARNNPPGLRLLPIANLHLKSSRNRDQK